MKKQLVAYLLLASFYGHAQEIFNLHDPGNSFLILEKGWTYRMVDSPEAMIMDSHNQGWSAFRPTSDIHDSIPAEARAGIGWMRLYIKVDQQVRGQHLAMMIRQSIASEIFLNGRRLRQYGIISKDPTEVRPYDPRWEPVVLNFSTDSIQLLAIRFAVQPGLRYAKYYGVTNPFLTIRLMRNDNAQITYKRIYMRPWMDFFMQGIIFMVFILHLAFYLMNPEQKANLFFALAALFSCIGTSFHNYYYYTAQADQKYISAILVSFFQSINYLLMLASILTFLKIGMFRLLYLFAGIFCIGILLAALWYPKGFHILIPLQMSSYLIIIGITFLAQKKRVPGARILIIGFSIAVISFFIFLASATSSLQDHLLNPPFNPRSYFFLLFLLGPPGALSIFLANDFARTSKRLQQKLDEVELLSEKNVAVEKEKQEILSSQNQQLELKVQERTAELNRSLTQVRETQAQLVQAEKMASLGELTAGIAHEIQNPLNFVNNFSEVSTELIAEMKDELKKGKINEAIEIADDIDHNLEKINHHGKRADAIVKGMLQHSRTSSGQEELTDINALADEYLRLSYHGLRAKDKNFNATLKTDFDDSIGNVKIIPQDIGRVLLNLFNNAFYAVMEKVKQKPEGYEPTVKVSTKKIGSKIEIRVGDNGNGIPSGVKEKIFQPFFTTKPTGQGTGLGLSLSYDIVKAHGGELKVETKEGVGTVIIIQLPI